MQDAASAGTLAEPDGFPVHERWWFPKKSQELSERCSWPWPLLKLTAVRGSRRNGNEELKPACEGPSNVPRPRSPRRPVEQQIAQHVEVFAVCGLGQRIILARHHPDVVVVLVIRSQQRVLASTFATDENGTSEAVTPIKRADFSSRRMSRLDSALCWFGDVKVVDQSNPLIKHCRQVTDFLDASNRCGRTSAKFQRIFSFFSDQVDLEPNKVTAQCQRSNIMIAVDVLFDEFDSGKYTSGELISNCGKRKLRCEIRKPNDVTRSHDLVIVWGKAKGKAKGERQRGRKGKGDAAHCFGGRPRGRSVCSSCRRAAD